MNTCHSRYNQTDVISRDSISAYFGDLGDGIHKGDENDPRVVIIEVVPDEVHYWLATTGAISRGVQEIAQAAQGKVAIPGELRTITKEEVSSLSDNWSPFVIDIGPTDSTRSRTRLKIGFIVSLSINNKATTF